MSWLVGIVAGYYLFHSKGKPMHLNKLSYYCLWIVAALLIIGVIFGPYEAHKPYAQVSQLVTAVHTTFSNFSWILAIAWITVACCKHPDGIANKFLSHSLWLPISRLSFSIYLVHLHLQYMMIASTKTNVHFSDIEILHSFFGDVGFALVIGLIWYLIYEIPFCYLAKYYLDGRKTQGTTTTQASKGIDTGNVQQSRAQSSTQPIQVVVNP